VEVTVTQAMYYIDKGEIVVTKISDGGDVFIREDDNEYEVILSPTFGYSSVYSTDDRENVEKLLSSLAEYGSPLYVEVGGKLAIERRLIDKIVNFFRKLFSHE